MAASHGEFELNTFLPLIADSLLENLALLTNAAELFRTKCIELVKPNNERCRELLDRSYAFATAYTSYLGYDKANKIIKESGGNILDSVSTEQVKHFTEIGCIYPIFVYTRVRRCLE